MIQMASNDRQALLFGGVAVLLWSTVATAFKVALAELSVWQLIAVASLSSALVLMIVVAARGQLGLLLTYFREAPRFYLMVACLNPSLYYLILFSAYDRLPAQQAQAINYTWAITLSLMAVLMLGQALRLKDLLAGVFGYTGVLIIATRGDVVSLRFDDGIGVVLALVSTVVWAWYWIVNTRNQHEPVPSLCLNFLLAAPLCVLLCSLFSDWQLPVGQGLFAAMYAGVFEMGITFALWSLALRRASHVSRVANLIFLAPLVSLLPIHFVLGESIDTATLVGLAMILPAALYQQLSLAN